MAGTDIPLLSFSPRLRIAHYFARRKGILFSPPQSIRTAPPKGGAENQKNFSAFLLGGLILSA